MRQNLLETYARQLKVAEAYVAKNFEGKQMSSNTALTTAVLLDNTNRWITESLENTLGATNRGDMGAWKKFCLNLTNIAVPSLIANDLVIVHPMTSYSGSVAYLKYVALTDKNGMEGKTLNSVFAHGEMNDARMNYTAQVIIEEGKAPTLEVDAEKKRFYDREKQESFAIKAILNDGSIKYVNAVSELGSDDVKKIAYFAKDYEFQMEQVPATNIPVIGPKMEHIPLVAEPRRIAVRYDQITAFQA
jgi:hypothetical protein